MGRGIIYVEKTLSGTKPWTNEYAFSDTIFSISMSEDLLEFIGAGVAYDDDNTNPDDVAYPDPSAATLIQAILAFERSIHYNVVQFTRVYVGDGLKNSEVTDIGPLASAFWTAGLSFSGIRALPLGGAVDIAPGNIVAYTRRAPMAFSQRSGHVSYRAVLSDSDVRFANDGGVGWQDVVTGPATFQALLDNSVAASGLDNYFGNGKVWGESNFVYTGIAKHLVGVPVPPQDEGDLVDVARITGLVIDQPRSRQKTRGRKRPA